MFKGRENKGDVIGNGQFSCFNVWNSFETRFVFAGVFSLCMKGGLFSTERYNPH